jgi:hypothetical protein
MSDEIEIKRGDELTVTIVGKFMSSFFATRSGQKAQTLILEVFTEHGDRIAIPVDYVTEVKPRNRNAFAPMEIRAS